MPAPPARVLIVEDEPIIRSSLSIVLTELGYSVRSAIEGFSALHEISQEMPDIVLSDLNMPGMSGFELLTIIRQRFPTIQSIAMSGAFSGEAVPAGVAADAFHQKGSSTVGLLQIIRNLPRIEQHAALSSSAVVEPVWLDRDEHNASIGECATIVCPKCLRTFSRPQDKNAFAGEADCVQCRSSIQYRMPQPMLLSGPRTVQQKANSALPAQSTPDQSY